MPTATDDTTLTTEASTRYGSGRFDVADAVSQSSDDNDSPKKQRQLDLLHEESDEDDDDVNSNGTAKGDGGGEKEISEDGFDGVVKVAAQMAEKHNALSRVFACMVTNLATLLEEKEKELMELKELKGGDEKPSSGGADQSPVVRQDSQLEKSAVMVASIVQKQENITKEFEAIIVNLDQQLQQKEEEQHALGERMKELKQNMRNLRKMNHTKQMRRLKDRLGSGDAEDAPPIHWLTFSEACIDVNKLQEQPPDDVADVDNNDHVRLLL